jgi:hypothetical protein
MKIFTMHKLKEGASIEDYKRWSLERDQPISNDQPEIRSFEVYAIQGSLDVEGDSPDYDVIEVVDVENTDGIQAVEERLRDFLDNEWIANWVDKSTLINLYGELI